MGPVSNIDHLVLLLRQRLVERSKSPSAKRGQPGDAGRQPTQGLDSVHALAAVDGIDDRQLRRALIQNILAEQFGAELINEAKFQQVVDRVTETIEGDDASAGLISGLVRELKASAR